MKQNHELQISPLTKFIAKFTNASMEFAGRSIQKLKPQITFLVFDISKTAHCNVNLQDPNK